MNYPNKETLPIINEIISKIHMSDRSVFLVGEKGSGKSVVINEFIHYKHDSDSLIVNFQINSEYLIIRDNVIYNLYYECLLIRSILLCIKEKFPYKFDKYFMFFTYYIEELLKKIICMYQIDNYSNSINYIDNDLLTNDKNKLIKELLNLINNKISIKNITVVIDDFDKIGDSSERFQNTIYNLNEYFKLVMTISDEKIIDKKTIINNLDGKIIEVNYNKDIDIVKEILDFEAMKFLKKNKIYDFNYRLRNILDDEIIILFIQKTNGNLEEMLFLITTIYENILDYSLEEFKEYLINGIMLFGEKNNQKRTLFLK